MQCLWGRYRYPTRCRYGSYSLKCSDTKKAGCYSQRPLSCRTCDFLTLQRYGFLLTPPNISAINCTSSQRKCAHGLLCAHTNGSHVASLNTHTLVNIQKVTPSHHQDTMRCTSSLHTLHPIRIRTRKEASTTASLTLFSHYNSGGSFGSCLDHFPC